MELPLPYRRDESDVSRGILIVFPPRSECKGSETTTGDEEEVEQQEEENPEDGNFLSRPRGNINADFKTQSLQVKSLQLIKFILV